MHVRHALEGLVRRDRLEHGDPRRGVSLRLDWTGANAGKVRRRPACMEPSLHTQDEGDEVARSVSEEFAFTY